MSTHVNDDGTWKEVDTGYVNDDGTWKEVDTGYVNDDGTWKESYSGSWVDISNVSPSDGGTGLNEIESSSIPSDVYEPMEAYQAEVYEISTGDLVYDSGEITHKVNTPSNIYPSSNQNIGYFSEAGVEFESEDFDYTTDGTMSTPSFDQAEIKVTKKSDGTVVYNSTFS